MQAAQSSSSLPFPELRERAFDNGVVALTDDALFEQTGIRIAFSERVGGRSEGPYASLNLSTAVGDSGAAVIQNVLRLGASLGMGGPIIRPKQVHGTDILVLDSLEEAKVAQVQEQAKEGADGVIVTVPGAAQLCFADCVPVIIASPTGAFAVVHAGWRGVMGSIAPAAVRQLARLGSASVAHGDAAPFSSAADAASSYNVYIGPYIHAECFECGLDVHRAFVERFGEACAPDGAHIDLGAALVADLADAGIDTERRLADADICTACDTQRFYSYRASGGVCGRHGALAFRTA